MKEKTAIKFNISNVKNIHKNVKSLYKRQRTEKAQRGVALADAKAKWQKS